MLLLRLKSIVEVVRFKGREVSGQSGHEHVEICPLICRKKLYNNLQLQHYQNDLPAFKSHRSYKIQPANQSLDFVH